MKKYSLAGLILIVVGIVALAYQGISYTISERIMSIESYQVTADKTKTQHLQSIVGGIELAGVIAVLIMGIKKD